MTLCDACGRLVELTRAGRLRRHNWPHRNRMRETWERRCHGSGKPSGGHKEEKP